MIQSAWIDLHLTEIHLFSGVPLSNANGVGPVQVLHCATSNLGLYCLLKYLFWILGISGLRKIQREGSENLFSQSSLWKENLAFCFIMFLICACIKNSVLLIHLFSSPLVYTYTPSSPHNRANNLTVSWRCLTWTINNVRLLSDLPVHTYTPSTHLNDIFKVSWS